jgi:hypothetical protein
MTAKTRAIPSLHREKFLAKEPGQVIGAASGNTTSPYCRAVSAQMAPRHEKELPHAIKSSNFENSVVNYQQVNR